MNASLDHRDAGDGISVTGATGWLRGHSSRIMTAGIVLAILYLGRSVLIPLVLAVMLSLLVAPLVRAALRRIRVGRTISCSLLLWHWPCRAWRLLPPEAPRSCASLKAFLNTNRMYNTSSRPSRK